MRRILYFAVLLVIFQSPVEISAKDIFIPDITLTSPTIPAANINQGSNNNIVYAIHMAVSTDPVTVTNIQFTLGGTHDANDLGTVLVYFNPTSPTIAGASHLNNTSALFAAPHLYNISINRSMATGSSGYFIIAVHVDNSATDNNTIKINGATSPVVFSYNVAANVTNNQTDAAGSQTIQAADITLTSTAVAPADVNQGSVNNIVYITQMAVTTQPVVVTSIQFTLGGTHDANDLGTVLVYFNPTSPTIAGAIHLNNTSALFAAPHLYNISINRSMATGSSGYFIIAVHVDNAATDNNTIKVNGANDPVTFGYSTAPNHTNNQTDAAGTQTIQAADITLTSTAVAPADVNQGSVNNIVYITQMAVTTQPVVVTSIQFTLGGTHDANDLGTVLVYFNPTSPTIAGAIHLNNTSALFAAPHLYNISINRSMATGSSGYFIIAVHVDNAATDNNTIKVNGATDPVTFGYSTAPNHTNNQTDAAGTITVQASDITLSTTPLNASNVKPGNSNHIVYIVQMNVATQPVNVNNIQFTLGGTHDADDLTTVLIYFNASAPTISGASLLNNAAANFAAPHPYTISINRSMTAGSSGYFIIAVHTSPTATIGNTIHINGATNPVVFGFTTAPNITNNQSNAAGVQTLPVTLLTFTAKLLQNQVQLKWSTSSEFNNSYFSIEHGTDGVNFKPIGRVNGSGTTSTAKQYGFVHNQPFFGNNYYRLNQTDLDGNYQFSSIVLANYNPGKFIITNPYPNPASQRFWIKAFSPETKDLLVELMGSTGNLVFNRTMRINPGTNNIEIDVAAFASGIYQIRVRDLKTGTSEIRQLIISR